MLDHLTTMDLIKKSQEGDEEAKTILIKENFPLIKSIVKRFRSINNDYDDLMQLGALGLIKAINNFQPSYDVKFSTYAVPMIIGEIKRFLRDDGIIKVSRAVKSVQIKINQYVSEYKNTYGKDPEIKMIAERFSISETDVVFAMDSSKYPVSLFEKTSDDDGQTLMDKIASPENADDNIDKMILRDTIMKLPERERKIIILRYFRDKTQSEIAEMFGISQVQISRIEAKIIRQLKDSLTQ